MVTVSTIQLFKGCKYDLTRNMSLFSGLSAQNAYYNTLPTLTYQARYNKMGDPFLISGDITDLIGYNYGRVEYKGIYFYFQVVGFSVNAEGQTQITYTIDAWETMRYQYGITLGAGYVNRSKIIDPKLRTPYQPTNVSTFAVTRLMLATTSYQWTILYTLYDNTNNYGTYGYFLSDQSLDILSGNWINKLKGAIDSDRPDWLSDNYTIETGFITPFPPSNIIDLVQINAWTYIRNVNGSYNTAYTDYVDFSLVDFENAIGETYTIRDLRGNVIWSADYGIHYDLIRAVLDVSIGSAAWVLYIYADTDHTTPVSQATLPCEPLDMINDAWGSYLTQKRSYDIQSRQTQNDQNLSSSLASIGTSALTGAVVGSVVPGVGTAVGAVAGAVTGAATSIVGYVLEDKVYGVKNQALTDELYKKAPDTLSLVGGGNMAITAAFANPNYVPPISCVCKETWDNSTINKVLDDYDNYGYYTDKAVDSVDDILQIGPFQGDCVVNGCDLTMASQIRNRLNNGVYFS